MSTLKATLLITSALFVAGVAIGGEVRTNQVRIWGFGSGEERMIGSLQDARFSINDVERIGCSTYWFRDAAPVVFCSARAANGISGACVSRSEERMLDVVSSLSPATRVSVEIIGGACPRNFQVVNSSDYL